MHQQDVHGQIDLSDVEGALKTLIQEGNGDEKPNDDGCTLDGKPEDLSPKSDGGIIRYIVTPTTTKGKTPNEGGLVEAHLIGKFEDRIFDERDVSFVIGEVSGDELITGVQTALQMYGKNETSRLVIKPEYAFGVKGHKEWNIPSNATVEYTVTLNNFERKSSKPNEGKTVKQANMQIVVNFFEKITLDVVTSAKVEDLMVLIKEKNGVVPQLQNLFFGGVQMEREKRLSDYNIQNNSRIDVIPVYPSTESNANFRNFHKNCENWMRAIMVDNGALISESRKWKEKTYALALKCVESKKECQKLEADLTKERESKKENEDQGLDLTENVSELTKKVTELEAENAELRNRVTKLETENAEMKKL